MTRLPSACNLAMVSVAEGPVGAAAAVPAPSAITPMTPVTPVSATCLNFMLVSIFFDSVTLQGYVDHRLSTTNSCGTHMISELTVDRCRSDAKGHRGGDVIEHPDHVELAPLVGIGDEWVAAQGLHLCRDVDHAQLVDGAEAGACGVFGHGVVSAVVGRQCRESVREPRVQMSLPVTRGSAAGEQGVHRPATGVSTDNDRRDSQLLHGECDCGLD